MKKILAIILAVAMCLSLGTAALAAEDVLLIAPAPRKGCERKRNHCRCR